MLIAREICFRLLDAKPSRRLKGKDVLNHPWISKKPREKEIERKPSQEYF